MSIFGGGFTICAAHRPSLLHAQLAEQRAWEMCKAQARWDLVTIHPGSVVGPPTSARTDSELPNTIRRLLKGDFWCVIEFSPPVPCRCMPMPAL